MIQFIKDAAQEFGWGWTIAVLIYVSLSILMCILASIGVFFGG